MSTSVMSWWDQLCNDHGWFVREQSAEDDQSVLNETLSYLTNRRFSVPTIITTPHRLFTFRSYPQTSPTILPH